MHSRSSAQAICSRTRPRREREGLPKMGRPAPRAPAEAPRSLGELQVLAVGEEQPYPCSKPLRSDKVSAGGREKVGPGTEAHFQKKGDKAVASVGENQDLSPRGSRERSENCGSGSSLQVAFGAGSLAPSTTPEDARDVFRGDVEVRRTRAPQACGSEVETLTRSGEGDAQSRK